MSTGWGDSNSETMDYICTKFDLRKGCIISTIIICIIVAIKIILDTFFLDIQKPSFEQVLNEIFKPYGCLESYSTMKLFMDIVNRDTSYFMINPEYYKKPVRYWFHLVNNVRDIQILFYKHGQVGHVLCVSYDSTSDAVNIYDSCVKLYTVTIKRSMERKLQEILGRLYPNHTKIVWKIPKNTQNDNSSCGVFTIAYASLLICGQDPELYELDFSKFKLFEMDSAILYPYYRDSTMPLRHHIWRMFRENRLIPFPTKYLI